jgi:hypothetical protein
MTRPLMGIALLFVASVCGAQEIPGSYTPSVNTSVVHGNGDIRSAATDPSAVEIPLYKGASIEAILKALKDKGFKIKWNPDDVLPTMTLLEKPKATRIDRLLGEILTPWDLKADHNSVYGEYRVRPRKKKSS